MNYYQDGPTDIELISWREPLETAAALQIGLLVFAFSRLELSLERYLDSVGPAAGAPDPRQMPLQRLMAVVDRLPDAAPRTSYRQWMVRAHRMEGLRVAVATGRWIPDRRRDCVMHEPGQCAASTEYRLPDLVGALTTLKELQVTLHRLCATERGITLAASEAFLSTQPIGPQAPREAVPA